MTQKKMVKRSEEKKVTPAVKRYTLLLDGNEQ